MPRDRPKTMSKDYTPGLSSVKCQECQDDAKTGLFRTPRAGRVGGTSRDGCGRGNPGRPRVAHQLGLGQHGGLEVGAGGGDGLLKRFVRPGLIAIHALGRQLRSEAVRTYEHSRRANRIQTLRVRIVRRRRDTFNAEVVERLGVQISRGEPLKRNLAPERRLLSL